MALEIERKFLVNPKSFAAYTNGKEIESWIITQGYLNIEADITTRVRYQTLTSDHTITKAYLTVKTKTLNSISKNEYEYEIPVVDALELLINCADNIIHKVRHVVPIRSGVCIT